MDYPKKWRVNDDSLIGTVMSQNGTPIAEVGPGKRTITATDAEHARLLKESNRFDPVETGAKEAEPDINPSQVAAPAEGEEHA